MKGEKLLKDTGLVNIFVRFTNWFSNLAILNLCWLFFSLPIITIIPATNALYEVLNTRKVSETQTGIFAEYKHHFKESIWKSYKWGLPILLVAIVIIVDIMILNSQQSTSGAWQIFTYAFYTLAILLVLIVLYAYPLSKRLASQSYRMFFLSLLMLVGHPLILIGFLISIAGIVLIFWFFPSMMFFALISWPAWFSQRVVDRILEKNRKSELSKK